MRVKPIVSVLVVAAAALTTGPARATAGWFTTSGAALSGSTAPVDVELADVTGDGKLDLLAVARGTGTLNVRPGTGSGSFSNGVAHGASGHTLPGALAVADFDADGKMDGVMTYESPSRLFVFRGVATGISATTFPIPPATPTAVAAGDVTGDGRPDIVVAGTSNQLATFTGNGNLTFGGPVITTLPTTGATAIALGDLTNDGRLDVVLLTPDGTLVKAVATSSGSFVGIQTEASVATTGRDLALADFNGDNLLDVAVSDEATHFVRVRRAQSGPGFPHLAAYGFAGPRGLRAHDFDGDGRADLAVTSMAQDNVATLIQRSGALSRLRHHASHGSSALDPVAVAVGDLTGDGHADFALANLASNTVSVLTSRPYLTGPSGYSGGSRTVGDPGPEHAWDLIGNGFVPVSIGAITLTGPHATDFEVIHACSNVTLAFDQACQVRVRFTPGGLGARSATLTVPSDSAGGPKLIMFEGVGTDGVAPVVDFDASDGDVLASPVNQATGTVTDLGTGVDTLTVTYTNQVPPLATISAIVDALTVNATLACDDPRRACTWSAPLPLTPGPYDVAATATDRNGNTATATLSVIVV